MEEVYKILTHTGAKWWDLKHSKEQETFESTQLWLDQTTKAVKVQVQTVGPAGLDAWLQRRTDDKGRTLIARFVWLSANGPNNEVNLTEAVQNTLCKQFGLKTAYSYFQTFVSGVASLPRHATPAFERQAFAFCFGPKLAAIWSHTLSKTSTTSDITQGIIFTKGDKMREGYLDLMPKIPWDHRICLTSALPAYLFSMVFCQDIDALQKKILGGVSNIEAHTGYHGFAERKTETNETRSEATKGMVEMSATASGFATKLASAGRKSDMIEQLLELMVIRAAEDLANRERLASSRGATQPEEDGGVLLKHHVDIMRQRMKMQGSETEYIQKRVQIQISAIFNTISQNDTLANLEVAEETSKIAFHSYRDASSMKTLAFVTMVFLPGSFISALFSTEVFNWDALKEADHRGLGVSVTPQFGLYWLITIPLTLIVFLLYYLWITHLKRELDKQRAEKPEKLVGRLAASSTGSTALSREAIGGIQRASTVLDHLARRRGKNSGGQLEKGPNAV